jgi:hypothetical protein
LGVDNGNCAIDASGMYDGGAMTQHRAATKSERKNKEAERVDAAQGRQAIGVALYDGIKYRVYRARGVWLYIENEQTGMWVQSAVVQDLQWFKA